MDATMPMIINKVMTYDETSFNIITHLNGSRNMQIYTHIPHKHVIYFMQYDHS